MAHKITQFDTSKIWKWLVGAIILLILYKSPQYIRYPFIAVQPHEAIPHHYPAFLECSNQYALPTQWDSLIPIHVLQNWSVTKKIPQDLRVLQSIVGEAFQSLKKRKMALAFAKGSGNDMDCLYVLDGFKKRHLQRQLSAFSGVKTYTFQNQTLYAIPTKNGRTITIALYKNVLLYARYAVLVEDAINQLKHRSTSICREKGFRVAYRSKKTTKKLYFYIHSRPLYSWVRPYLNKKFITQSNDISQVFDWIGVEIDLTKPTPSNSTINGAAYIEKGNTFLSFLMKNKDIEVLPDMVLKLPTNTAWFEWMPITEKTFSTQEEQLFLETKTAAWLGNEAVVCMTEPYSTSLQEEQFLVLECTDYQMLEQTLYEENAFLESSVNLYNGFKINRLDSGVDLRDYIPFAPKSMQQPYLTLFEDMLVFSNNLSALQVFIDQHIVNQVLGKDDIFLQQYAKLDEHTDVLCYFNPKQHTHLFQSVFQTHENTVITELTNLLPQGNAVLLQGELKGKTVDINGVIANAVKKENSNSNTNIFWRTSLDATVRLAPQSVAYKNEKAIFTQDKKHTIYLINKNGKIVWKRPLDEAVLSKIYEVDYYDSSDIYYLFNTKGKVYLLDEKGRDANLYPFDLQSNATNGLLAVDFDHINKFDYFIACKNGNIYGFDQKGRPLSGWNPNFNHGIIEQPFQHFQHENKDYIVSLNTQSKLEVFQRNGKARFAPVFLRNATSFAIDTHTQSTRIVSNEAEGKVRIVNTLGKSFNLAIAPQATNTLTFCFADLVGDRRKDYFVQQGQQLLGKYYEESSLKNTFSTNYSVPQDTFFPVQLFGTNKQAIGSFCKRKKQIQLLGSDGTFFKNFPLAATTSFVVTDLFDNQQNILIVGYEKDICVYQISK